MNPADSLRAADSSRAAEPSSPGDWQLQPRHVVVVGAGMAAHRFVEQMLALGGVHRLTVIGDEPALPYDRVHLSEYFLGRTPQDLALTPSVWDDDRVTLLSGDPVAAVDRASRTVTTRSGLSTTYHTLVFATGSWAWTPRTEGTDLPGVFSYRTLADVEGLAAWVRERSAALGRPLRGVVVGGGVLGLEAAAALQTLGAQASVVEFADRLMGVQLDDGGGEALRVLITDMGIDVHLGVGASALRAADGSEPDGVAQAPAAGVGPAVVRSADVTSATDARAASHAVGRVVLSDERELPADVVVFSTGIRPRDRIARESGLATGERGGIVIGPGCQTTDPDVYAIGECASLDGECVGLVAPGNAMADVVANRLHGGSAVYEKQPEGTKLKGVGIDAASFGDVFALTPGALEVTFADPVSKTYKKLVVSDDARTLLGGVFVGDIALYSSLRPLLGRPLGADPSAFLAPEGGAPAPTTELPDDVVVCSCANVTAGTIRGAVTEHHCTSVGEVKACTKAGTVCGSCVPLLTTLVNATLEKAGVAVSHAMCEHFACSRAELFTLVVEEGLQTFSEVVAAHGTGRGCNICKPVVASILASLKIGHVLSGDQAPLQDTNDRLLANMQRDGTYSVIPRIPGGEITPEKLAVIARVGAEYGLMTRITGAQRIGLFGARADQLPAIWRELVDAGFESGQAYGKSLRNVKTCVGKAWCRFGVQDSTSMAIRVEMRYRGLRSPHKFKMGVSGCARECAEARGKDIGVIATEKGWNLYVGGNGGFTPRHADLLAEDLDDDTLIRTIDRFLALYISEGDRLQRTAPFVAAFPGGIEELRRVILEDSRGMGVYLDALIANHVDSYEDEWRSTLEDPEKLRRFVSFVNAPGEHDPDLAYTNIRGQIRPARADEPSDNNPVIARTLEVRPS